MAPTLVQQIWHKLDEVMEQALTWNGPGKKKEIEDPHAEWMNDRFDYLTKTSVGRGLAEALVIMCQPAFENSDQVVKLAVARYKAKSAGEDMPETPGFTGSGQTGDSLRVMGQGKEADIQTTPSIPTPTPSPVPTPAGPKKKKSKLSDTAIAAIKKGIANGFDAETFADMYGVSVAEVKAVVV